MHTRISEFKQISWYKQRIHQISSLDTSVDAGAFLFLNTDNGLPVQYIRDKYREFDETVKGELFMVNVLFLPNSLLFYFVYVLRIFASDFLT